VYVGDCREKIVDGFRIHVEESVTDGDGGDFGARVERKHVSVNPSTCDGAIVSDRVNHVIWNGEEERDVGVEKTANDGWIWFFETEGGELEILHGGGDAVLWWW
jgi:hypothetical protein